MMVINTILKNFSRLLKVLWIKIRVTQQDLQKVREYYRILTETLQKILHFKPPKACLRRRGLRQ